MLDKLRMNESRKPNTTDKTPVPNAQILPESTGYDTRKISIKKVIDNKTASDTSSARNNDDSSGSDLYNPAIDAYDESVKVTNVEMDRIKWELEAAKAVINQQKRELEETRNSKHIFNQPPANSFTTDGEQGEPRTTSMHR